MASEHATYGSDRRQVKVWQRTKERR